MKSNIVLFSEDDVVLLEEGGVYYACFQLKLKFIYNEQFLRVFDSFFEDSCSHLVLKKVLQMFRGWAVKAPLTELIHFLEQGLFILQTMAKLQNNSISSYLENLRNEK